MTSPNALRLQDNPDPAHPWRTESPAGKSTSASTPPKRKWSRWLVWGIALYGITFLITSWQDMSQAAPTVSYSEFTAQVQAHNVKDIYATGDTIQGDLKVAEALPGANPATTYTTFQTQRPTFAADNLYAELTAGGAVVQATPVSTQRGTLLNLLISFAPFLLIIGFYVWMFRRQAKGMGMGGLGGVIGKTHKPVDPSHNTVTFADVAGIDEVKGQVDEIVDFLKNPAKYAKLGARSPRGVLLSGAPGTGKTLLARATAGEAGVPFFSVSAAEFIEMIVGVGAQRVRDLFTEARKAAPAIIFIDEIDTIGRSRAGARAIGGNDEREQTLNQILTEMDGFDGSEGVVVLAATNRADVLDSALTRPGRFDRVITVHSPDRPGRAKILDVHMRAVPLDVDVDVEALAKATPGMTGAELANLVNEGAILAARREDTRVHQADFFDALEKVQLGVARNVVIPPDQRRRTAYHEAGHALLGMLQPGADPVRKISIIPRGRALGVTLSTPDDDRYGFDEAYLRGRIIGALGGLAAERVVLGFTTTGVDSDLEAATAIARQMVGRWGMSAKVGPMTVLGDDIDPHLLGISEATLATADAEARRIITECEAEAVTLIRENRPRLDRIVTALLQEETLDEDAAYAAAGLDHPHAPHQVIRFGGDVDVA